VKEPSATNGGTDGDGGGGGATTANNGAGGDGKAAANSAADGEDANVDGDGTAATNDRTNEYDYVADEAAEDSDGDDEDDLKPRRSSRLTKPTSEPGVTILPGMWAVEGCAYLMESLGKFGPGIVEIFREFEEAVKCPSSKVCSCACVYFFVYCLCY
jgi:hypothetical protein